MVIPERTRRVHKVVVPFFLLKIGGILFSLTTVLLFIIAIDYVHVLGRMAENKRLKGENFKLRQEIQQIRNKVDSMETTIERVRNYAKKLQLLTGQGDKTSAELPVGPLENEFERAPASKKRSGSRLMREETTGSLEMPEPELRPDGYGMNYGREALGDRVEKLQAVSRSAEADLSMLQAYLLTRSAIIDATPSLLPITGWISSTFGYRRHPIAGVFRMHTGIDIAADPGTPVRAPAQGTVIYSGYREGYGKVVVLDHGYGIRTLFAHNSKLFATVGSRVRRGEIISEVGSTGMSTGPHLHYEVRKNGVPVNPATFFSRARF